MYKRILVPVDGSARSRSRRVHHRGGRLLACEPDRLRDPRRRGLRRMLMGSDAEYVLRHSAVPVLLVRGGPSGASP
jgi:nucleotide-binding universal stress UspA family protein